MIEILLTSGALLTGIVSVASIKILSKKYDGFSRAILKLNESLATKVEKDVIEIKDLLSKQKNWEMELHRLLMSEYAKFPKGRIYGFVYVYVPTSTERMVLVTADTFEDAQVISQQILTDEDYQINNWILKGHTFIEVPKTTTAEQKQITEKVEKEAFPTKPIEVFVSDLKLIRDRFSEGNEGEVLQNLINRIETKYGNNTGK